jgi:hypothetical protein
MWAILKSLIVQGIIARTALRSLGWLAWLLPVGFLLKWVGLPILMVLGVLALPVLLLFLVIGLPIFVVLLFGGAMLSLLGVLLTLGVALAKIVVPLVIVVFLLRWMLGAEPQTQSPAHSPSRPPDPSAS